jgi:hypothetical protein
LWEGAPDAAIHASGAWMIIAGLTKLWGEWKSRTSRPAFVFVADARALASIASVFREVAYDFRE